VRVKSDAGCTRNESCINTAANDAGLIAETLLLLRRTRSWSSAPSASTARTRAERVLLLTDQCTNRETYGLLGRLNWDLAMLVELAKKDEDAMEALAKALAVIRERWEPETTARNVRTVGEVIRKGKSGKSNEFGKVVKLEEAENQIIIEYEVCARRPNDAHLLIPAIETHQAKLGRAPRDASARSSGGTGSAAVDTRQKSECSAGSGSA